MVFERQYANEFVLMDEVRPIPTDPPTGMVLAPGESSKSYIDEFGVEQSPPAGWDYLSAPTGQRDTSTDLVFVATVGDRTYTNTVTYSDRLLIPWQWVTKIEDSLLATTFEKSWLLVGVESGTGSAMQMNEVWQERWEGVAGLGNRVDMAYSNPNQAGAGQYNQTPDAIKCYGGRPLLYRATGNVIETACSPMDFGGGGDYPLDHTDKGDTPTRPAWWYSTKFYQRVEYNYGGLATCHRVDYWSYTPTPRWSNGESGPALNYRSSVYTMIGFYFDIAFLLDMANPGSPIEISDAFAYDGVDLFKTWEVGRAGISSPDGVPFLRFNLSNAVVVAMANVADDFAIAVMVSLEQPEMGEGFGINGGTGANKLGGYTSILLQQAVLAAHAPGSTTSSSFTSFQPRCKSLGPRPAGWIGTREFLFVGKVADVMADISAAYFGGALATAPINPPVELTAGTIFPPEAEPS